MRAGRLAVSVAEAATARIGPGCGEPRGRRRGLESGAFVGNSLAGHGLWGSLTPMTHRRRTQPPYGSARPSGPALDVASVEAVARRVVELLRAERHSPRERRLVDAATLAAELGVERSWVYTHRAELGGIRLGAGSKPRLRFDVDIAGSCWPVLQARSRRRREHPRLRAVRHVAVVSVWAAAPTCCPYEALQRPSTPAGSARDDDATTSPHDPPSRPRLSRRRAGEGRRRARSGSAGACASGRLCGRSRPARRTWRPPRHGVRAAPA